MGVLQNNEIFDKIISSKLKFFLIIWLFLSSCTSTNPEKIKQKQSLDFQKSEMDKALGICHDIFLKPMVSFSDNEAILLRKDAAKQGLEKYQLAKQNSGNLWQEYSKKNNESFYRDQSAKNTKYSVSAVFGLISFGILLLPFLMSSSDLHGGYPSYQTIIEHCDWEYDRLELEKKIKKESEQKQQAQIDLDLKWQDEERAARKKAEIEMEEKWKSEEKREQEKRLKIIKEHKAQKQENDNYAKNLGYKNGMTYGIKSTISKVISGAWSRNNAANYLIARNIHDDFRVKNIIDDYVIFGAFKNYDLIQIAVVKDEGEDYITSSILNGKYFAVVGKQTFTTTFGQNMEVLVFKKVN